MIIKQFDVSKIQKDAAIMIVGKRGSGKSWLIKHLCYVFKNVGTVKAYSTADSGLSAFIPDSFISRDYNEDDLKEFIDARTRVVAKRRKKTPEPGRYEKRLKDICAIIFDDVATLLSNHVDRTFLGLFTDGRHKDFLIIYSIQNFMKVNNACRDNMDYLFMFKEHNTKTLKNIYEQCLGGMCTFREFQRIHNAATDNYGCLVINKSGTSLETMLYVFRAPATIDFKMGSSMMWRLHEKYYDRDYLFRDIERGEEGDLVL